MLDSHTLLVKMTGGYRLICQKGVWLRIANSTNRTLSLTLLTIYIR